MPAWVYPPSADPPAPGSYAPPRFGPLPPKRIPVDVPYKADQDDYDFNTKGDCIDKATFLIVPMALCDPLKWDLQDFGTPFGAFLSFAANGTPLLLDLEKEGFPFLPDAQQTVCDSPVVWQWYVFVCSDSLQRIELAKPLLTVTFWEPVADKYEEIKPHIVKILEFVNEIIWSDTACDPSA